VISSHSEGLGREAIRFFVSYHRDDNKYAFPGAVAAAYDQIRFQLTAYVDQPVEGFMDVRPECQSGGDDWKSLVDTRIGEAAVFLPFVTKGFLHSDECTRELDLFRKLHVPPDGTVIPLFLVPDRFIRNETRRPDLASFLLGKTYRDLSAVWHDGGINTPAWNRAITVVVDDILRWYDAFQRTGQMETGSSSTKPIGSMTRVHLHTHRLPVDDFSPREQKVDEIHRVWDARPVPTGIVLRGPIGSGKTQLALWLMHQAVADEKISIIAWLDGSTFDTLRMDLADLAIRLGLMRSDEHLHTDQASKRVLNFLAETSQAWMLFVDNADESFDELASQNLFPQAHDPNHRVIITTRSQSSMVVGQGRVVVEIEYLSVAESLAYLKSRLPDQSVALLAAVLGQIGHPAFLWDTKVVRDYISGNNSFSVIASGTEASSCLLSLSHAGLVSIANQDGIQIVRMHPLLAEGYMRQASSDDIAKAVSTVVHGLSQGFVDPPRDRRLEEIIAANILHVAVNYCELPQLKQDLLEAVCVSATRLIDMGALDGAASMLNETIRAVNSQNTVDTAQTFALKRVLAQTQGEGFQPQQAARSLGLLLPLARSQMGADAMETVNIQVQLGHYLGESEHASQAEEILTQVVDTLSATVSANSFEVLIARSELAWWQGETHGPVDAIVGFRDILNARQKLLGTVHPDTLKSEHNLAFWLGVNEDFEESIALFRRNSQHRIEVLGPYNIDTYVTRSNLAWTLGRASKDKEAVSIYQALLPDVQANLGETHPFFFRVQNNLGATLFRAGRLDEATLMLRLAFNSRLLQLGFNSPYTLRTANWLAQCLAANGRTEESDALIDRIREVGSARHVEALR